MSASAILLMAGTGSRFQKDLPKQFHLLCGKKIYLHTLDVFVHSNLFREVILVCPPAYMDVVRKETKDYPSIKIVQGGDTRQASSFQGLIACSSTTRYVLIHDVVRPFVTKELLLENLTQVKSFFAIDTCTDCTDTVVQSIDQKQIHQVPDRKTLFRGQTPQTFLYDLIIRAHKSAQEKGITSATDDCQLVLNFGHPVHIVKGSPENIKITTPLDLSLAEQILRAKSSHFPKQLTSLEGKKYILIGASGGIGTKIHKLLEKRKAIVIPASRQNSKYAIDLSDTLSIKGVFQKIHQEYGQVDGLINCAGVLSKTPLEQMSEEEIQRLIHINLTGVIISCKLAKIKKNGHILNVASSSFIRGRKGYGVYSCAKAGLVNFTQALAEEQPNLFVNAIVPQRTNTSMRRKHFPEEDTKNLLSPEKVALKIIETLQSNCTANTIEIRS